MSNLDYRKLLKKVQDGISTNEFVEDRFKLPKAEIFYEGNTTLIKNFDKIGVMRSGKIEEMGSYEELMAKKGLLYELVTGKR